MKEREDILKEALVKIIPLKRAGVAITVRGGKTWLAQKHMEHFYTDSIRVLIVAPKLSIFTSWRNLAKDFNMEYLLGHMEFTTYLSLDKQDLKYDIVYLDECHSLLNTHNNWLSQYQGTIIGLTGTPPKYHHSEKGQMVDKYCPIVYTYETDEAVGDKILNDYRIIIHPLQLSTKKDLWIQGKGKGWFTSEKVNYDYWTNRVSNASSQKEIQIMRIMRMKALMNFNTKEVYAKKLLNSINEKVILFANEQLQAERMCANSYHANNPDSEENLEMFKQGTIMKLSCIHQLSEGVTIPDLSQAVIMHSYSNERKSSQRIGRCMSLSPDKTATIHVLIYEHTIDANWCQKALEDYDSGKITYKETNQLIKI